MSRSGWQMSMVPGKYLATYQPTTAANPLGCHWSSHAGVCVIGKSRSTRQWRHAVPVPSAWIREHCGRCNQRPRQSLQRECALTGLCQRQRANDVSHQPARVVKRCLRAPHCISTYHSHVSPLKCQQVFTDHCFTDTNNFCTTCLS